MSQPKSTNIGIRETGAFMKILHTIIQMFQTLRHWFSPPNLEIFTQDEYGELMRRYMNRQNWFDKISYNWTNRSAFQKVTFIVGLTLFSILVGLFIGAPTIIALSVGFVALIFHSLLRSNEEERQISAKTLTTETLSLNMALLESKKVFSEKIVELGDHAKELQNANKTVNSQLSLMKLEDQKIIQQNSKLMAQADSLNVNIEELTKKHTAVEVKYKDLSTHLENCSQEVAQTTATVATMGVTLSDFSNAVTDQRQSQIVFSQAANSFCLFVNELTQSRIEVTSEADSSDDYLNQLLKQNEEDDALLEAIGLNTARFTAIP